MHRSLLRPHALAIGPSASRSRPHALAIGPSASRSRPHALATALSAALLLLCACDDQPLRRMASSCGQATECESGDCYLGVCSMPCLDDKDCAGLLCLEGHCLPADTPCDDGNVCTAVDGWVDGKCAGLQAKVCQADSVCQTWACLPTVGCAAKARNEDGFCEAQLRLCGGGGQQSSICKCAYWQGIVHGPGDVVQDSVIQVDGADALHAAARANQGVLAVGATALASGKSQGWFARINGAGQTAWQKAIVATPELAAGLQALDGVVAAGTGWLAVGRAGVPSVGWLVQIDAGGEVAWATTLPAPLGADGLLRGVAALGKAGLAVGTQRAANGSWLPWVVAFTPGSAKPISGALPLPFGYDRGGLAGVVALGSGALAVGEVGTASTRAGWIVRLDAAGKVLAQHVVLPNSGGDGFLTGVAAGDGAFAALGASRLGTATQRAWLVELDADGAPSWQAPVNAGDGTGDAAFTAALRDGSGRWLAVGSYDAGARALAALVASPMRQGAAVTPVPVGQQARGLTGIVSVTGAFLVVGSHAGATGTSGWAMRTDVSGKDGCP